MLLEFTKMHGLGNDFIVIDATRQPFSLSDQAVRQLAHRRHGVGFDQLLIVEPPSVAEAQFNYRIFNADGGEVENCGNGARCFARFVVEKNLTERRDIAVMTSAGLMQLQVLDNWMVRVVIGTPELVPEKIPFVADQQAISYELAIGPDEGGRTETVSIGAVAIGNPHAVTQVDDVATAAVARLGPLIENHQRFPNRVNAGFMQIEDRGHVKVRVYERGVGETMACGTGACAAVVAGVTQGVLDHVVRVRLTGGDLDVNWPGPGSPVVMTGPAETVFEGRIEL